MGEPGPLKFEVVPVTTPADGPLAVELIPAPDPWDVARKLAHLPHLLFLDSAERHSERGRYSHVTAAPNSFGRRDRRLHLSDLFPPERSDLKHLPLETAKGLPPFQGGIAGAFGY